MLSLRHLAAASLLFAAPAVAQNQPAKQPAPRFSKPPAKTPAATPGAAPAKPAPAAQPKTKAETITLVPGAIEMSDELFRLDAAGLAMHLPLNAKAQITAAAVDASAKVTPPDGDQSWVIGIQVKRTRDKTQNPESVCRGVLQQLLASVGVVNRDGRDREGNVVEKLLSTKGTVIEPVKNVIVRAERPEFERPAARFYVKIPREEGKSALVHGYTVFQTAPGEFVLFDVKTLDSDFAKSRPVYEATLATARFSDVAMLMANRGAAVEAGSDFLARMSDPDYDAAINLLRDQWYRLAKPAAGGADNDAEEVAYRRVRANRGSRGEIDPSSRREKWGQVEREAGIVVRIDARYLQPQTSQVVDWVGIYWVSNDGKSEAWSVQQAIRDRDPAKKKASVMTETGAREGDQMSVSLTGNGQENRRIKPDVPKIGYISQVHAFLLPSLLVQKNATGQFGFYVYQSQTDTGSITMRRDQVKAEEGLQKTYSITTQLAEDRPAQVSMYRESGELIQTIFAADKLNWTPTTLNRLAELWKAKGLPMN